MMKSVAVIAAVVGCCIGACSPNNGTNGQPGVKGELGPSGRQGQQGATGEAGAPGSPGSPGSPGEAGAPGETGSVGPTGSIACGSVEISPQAFGSSCGGGTTTTANSANGLFAGWYPDGSPVCLPGGVACEMASVGDAGSALFEVCANANSQFGGIYVSTAQAGTFTQNPVVPSAGSRCDEDLDCNNTPDDTTGAGLNVVLLRPALTYQETVQSSQSDAGVIVFVAGLCRNAQNHCLGSAAGDWCETEVSNGRVVVSCDGFGNPISVPVSGNREGVQVSDFGDISETCTEASCTLNSPVGGEAKIGTECVDSNGTVRQWACSIDASNVASVACVGPVQ